MAAGPSPRGDAVASIALLRIVLGLAAAVQNAQARYSAQGATARPQVGAVSERRTVPDARSDHR
jgi:hypothetical protein